MSHRTAKYIYYSAATYGVLAVAPQYFLEERIGRDLPPPINHPEYFYGFVGLALVWQFAFFVIGSDPVRFRPLMPITVLEKLSFGLAAIVLYLQGRLAMQPMAFGILDLVLGALFTWAYLSLRKDSTTPQ